MHNQIDTDTRYIEDLNETLDIDNYQDVLSKIYKYVKKVSPNYLNDGTLNMDYENIKLDIMLTEERIRSLKIIDYPVYLNFDIQPKTQIEGIVLDARTYLLDEHDYIGYNQGVLDIDFTNDCKKAAEYVKNICDKNKIECHIIKIEPGYSSDYMLFDGSGKHFANVIKYNNEYYLIDITYSQFFYSRRNNLDRLGVVDLSGCAPGIFMLMTEERRVLSKKLVIDGYIKLNSDIFKTYMDGFTLSFRNGTYYESTNDFSFTTPYTVDDYVNFLNGKDSQVEHEGTENLGFQKKLLKNPNMNFRREV